MKTINFDLTRRLGLQLLGQLDRQLEQEIYKQIMVHRVVGQLPYELELQLYKEICE